MLNVGGLFELHGPINATTAMNAARTVYFKGFSQAVASHGITTNTIVPGVIDSEQIRRAYPTPEALAEALQIVPMGRVEPCTSIDSEQKPASTFRFVSMTTTRHGPAPARGGSRRGPPPRRRPASPRGS